MKGWTTSPALYTCAELFYKKPNDAEYSDFWHKLIL
jgi:hypothetical protein